MEPSGPEKQEDSFVENKSDVDYGVFALISVVVVFVLRIYLQLDYLNRMQVVERPPPYRLPWYRYPASKRHVHRRDPTNFN